VNVTYPPSVAEASLIEKLGALQSEAIEVVTFERLLAAS
jgi:hypothetical protein